MARLSKRVLKQHEQAMKLLEKDILSVSDREFVYKNIHEGAISEQGRLGAFFTPLPLAFEFILNTFGFLNENTKLKVIDLCAGIGNLSRALLDYFGSTAEFDITCVELNSSYVDIGKKLVPEAKWICADVLDLDLILSLGSFDFAISNPPFGKVPTISGKKSFFYTGGESEYKVLDIASVIADHIGFIVPQSSAGYKYSGQTHYEEDKSQKYIKFVEQTNIELSPGIPIDTACGEGCEFKNTNILVEFLEADTSEIKASLFNTHFGQQAIF